MASAVSALEDTVRAAMIRCVCDSLQDYLDDRTAAPWEVYIVTSERETIAIKLTLYGVGMDPTTDQRGRR